MVKKYSILTQELFGEQPLEYIIWKIQNISYVSVKGKYIYLFKHCASNHNFRCFDPTEFGAYMNCILCKICKGNVVPLDPYKSKQWKCEVCSSLVSSKEVGNIFSLIGSILKGLNEADFHLIYKFVSKKLISLVPESHETCVELKYRMVWILGYRPGYTWKGMWTYKIDI